MSHFVKIRSSEAELFNVDGQPGGLSAVRKLIVVFRNFVNPPKNRGVLLPKEDRRKLHQADRLVSRFQAKELSTVSAKPSRLYDKESYLYYEQN